jgi:hypothetical protein
MIRICQRLVCNGHRSQPLRGAAIVVTHSRKRATVSSVSDLATGIGG